MELPGTAAVRRRVPTLLATPMATPMLTPRRRLGLAVALTVLTALTASLVLVQPPSGARAARCEQFARDSTARAAHDTGSGDRVVVLGDSWSAGLGLADSTASWPSRLPGRVHVAGFSGSGFSAGASPCGAARAFGARAPGAVRGGASLVVVEGGLNDWDQSSADIASGFDKMMRTLRTIGTEHVVVVGPAAAPSRAAYVPRVDAVLARLCAAYDVAYVPTSDLELPYLRDRLHLTPAGHRAFGDAVARRISALG